jgi:hypothetical protein
VASNERRLYLGATGAIGVFRSDAIGPRSEPRPFDNPLLVFPARRWAEGETNW